MYKIRFARNYRTRVANTLLLDNALAGCPSAIAADHMPANGPGMTVTGFPASSARR